MYRYRQMSNNYCFCLYDQVGTYFSRPLADLSLLSELQIIGVDVLYSWSIYLEFYSSTIRFLFSPTLSDLSQSPSTLLSVLNLTQIYPHLFLLYPLVCQVLQNLILRVSHNLILLRVLL
uniref:Uncharacterized protein n=2 Tax=Cacopsylla melanoneura TaxID=428564 RepID=A0A8D9AY37_9HEMI